MDDDGIALVRALTGTAPLASRRCEASITPANVPRIVGDLPAPAVDSPANVAVHANGRNNITRLLCVRHGATLQNASVTWMGGNDITTPISVLGQRQVDAQAVALAGEPIDIAYESGCLRSTQTCETIVRANVNANGIQIVPDRNIRSWDCGDWSGKSRSEIRNATPEAHQRWEADDPDFAPPNGERLGEYRERIRKAATAIARRHAGQTVLYAGHGGGLKALHEMSSSKVKGDRFKDYPDNGTIFEFHYDHALDAFNFIGPIRTDAPATAEGKSEASPRHPADISRSRSVRACLSAWSRTWHPSSGTYQFRLRSPAATAKGEDRGHLRKRPSGA